MQDTSTTASAAAIAAGPPRAFPKPPTNAGPKALAIVEAASPQFQAEIAVVIAFPRHIVMYLTSLLSSLSESLARCNT